MLKIDLLPDAVHEEIKRLRCAGKTWDEIEKLSQKFAGQTLPHSSLQRWWDLRVGQVQAEVLAKLERARAFAASLAAGGFKGLPDAVRNALGDAIFALTEAGDEESEKQMRRELLHLGRLLAQHRRLDILQQRAATEDKRVALLQEEDKRKRSQFDQATNEAAAKIGKGKALGIADINRIRERTFGLPPVQRQLTAGNPA